MFRLRTWLDFGNMGILGNALALIATAGSDTSERSRSPIFDALSSELALKAAAGSDTKAGGGSSGADEICGSLATIDGSGFRFS